MAQIETICITTPQDSLVKAKRSVCLCVGRLFGIFAGFMRELWEIKQISVWKIWVGVFKRRYLSSIIFEVLFVFFYVQNGVKTLTLCFLLVLYMFLFNSLLFGSCGREQANVFLNMSNVSGKLCIGVECKVF